jgi:hypothetical protein
MRTLVSEFLTEYVSVYNSNLTLKFQNLTHYSTIIEKLGPLYNMWVMRCEGEHADSKKVALCSGNFKNVCKTIAARHQMRQAERFMAHRGLADADLQASKRDTVFLCQLEDGQKVSDLLGSYGLYREIFQPTKFSVFGIYYVVGDVILHGNDDGLQPLFMQIDYIFISDSREAHFVGRRLQKSSP